MSIPRQVLPGTRYLITRRCTQRQFWLKPSKITNNILAYCLAWATSATGVKLHAYCAISNHWHLVITDVEGRLPEFLRMVHVYTAKALNASYGRWENLWASEPTSAVRLEDDDDVLDKIAYCLTNPVAAGLVPSGAQWPGLCTSPRKVAGGRETITRPEVFFRREGSAPKTVTLETTRPDIYTDRSDNALGELVASIVATREAKLREAMRKAKRRFLGKKKVMTQRPEDHPGTRELRRGLSPRVAAKNKWARVEALQRIKEFLKSYRQAYLQLREGIRDVIFPAGTYALRRYHGVAVVAT